MSKRKTEHIQVRMRTTHIADEHRTKKTQPIKMKKIKIHKHKTRRINEVCKNTQETSMNYARINPQADSSEIGRKTHKRERLSDQNAY